MDFIDGGFSGLADFVSTIIPEGIFQNFITKGIIGGVGSVVIFIKPPAATARQIRRPDQLYPI